MEKKQNNSMERLHCEPITEKLRREALTLRTAKGQEGFIESVAQCLAEADGDSRWKPIAILDGEHMVGFAMYGFFRPEYPPEGRLWLDRLLIDAGCQGMGYGKAAMADLLDRLAGEYPNQTEIYLSVIQGNDAAISLYQQFGFAFNEERDTKGEFVMVKEVPAR